MSEKIQVLIVDDLPETRENVRKLLQFEPDVDVVGQAGRGDEAVEMARQHVPDIILMDINMPGMDGITASQTIKTAVPRSQIIIMSVQSEADYLRRAMLAGARDFLMKPFTGDELITAIRRVYESRPAEPQRAATAVAGGGTGPLDSGRPPERGKVITVFSPKGGSGSTTVAMNVAVALAEMGQETLLIDGSLQFGDVAVMLNMRPTTSIVDLVDRMNELDKDLISSVALAHDSGLKVLLAPPRPEMAELVTTEHLEVILPIVRDIYDFVVIDTSSVLSDLTLTLLDAADRVLLVTQQDLPNLTNSRRFFDLTDELEYDNSKVQLVVNRSSSRLRITVKDVANTLKRQVVMAVPIDDDAAAEAVNQGVALVGGQFDKRPIADAFRRLSQRIREQLQENEDGQAAVVESEKGSRLARLFGNR